MLVHGAAGAVGRALLMLGRLAGIELWGTARGEHMALVRELGATPIDYQHEDFHAGPAGRVRRYRRRRWRRRLSPLIRGAQARRPALCHRFLGKRASAASHAPYPVMEIARLYLWRLLPGGKRARFYSVNAMRARHPTWFKEDLERLFGLLATGAIRPRIARADLLPRGRRCSPSPRDWWPRGQARAVPRISRRDTTSAPPETALQTCIRGIDSWIASLRSQ